MKRVNEIDDGDSEDFRLKKVRVVNGNDDSSSDLDINKCTEELSAFVENGRKDSARVDENENRVGDMVSYDLDGSSIGGGEKSSKLGFDINVDLNVGNEESESFDFDLNLPPYGTQNGGMEKGCLEDNREPMSNEKKVDVIDIESDDSDDDVEVMGYTSGYNNAKGKEVELGIANGRTENLSLGLGMIGTNNDVGESSLAADGARRYTREEKGKAVSDSWLSLNANPDGLYLLAAAAKLVGRTNERVEENVEVGRQQPARLPVRAESAERAAREAERVARYREETARPFGRANFQNQNNVKESSSEKQKPTESPIDQLGNSSGPFSDALRMVRERTKRSAKQLIEWKPLKENQDGCISAPFVPSLLDLSLKALAENAEGLVSLEMVPDNLRGRLIDRLCDTSKMNVHIMNLLLEGCPTEIRIKNCLWLTEKQFQQTFGNCQTKDLRVLQLDLCGKCMNDFALRDILAHSPISFSSLAIVSLRGACRLSDSGLQVFVMSAPLLRSINLGHCTLLTSNAIKFIADSLGSNLRELYIDGCPKINAMQMLPAFKKFIYLEVLSVAGIHSMTDEVVSEIITVCGQSIKELDFANCLNLTDSSLKSIGSNCADLCSLNISKLHNLTDLGLEYLANGCRSIRVLKLCRNDFSDEAMAAYIESSGGSLTELVLNHMKKVGPNTALSLAKRSRNLLSLDISSCRGINDEALGLIVDSCSSLKLLKVFCCRQITNVFLNGHSNQRLRIIGLPLTPLMDHLNLLQPNGVLLRYSPLPNLQ